MKRKTDLKNSPSNSHGQQRSRSWGFRQRRARQCLLSAVTGSRGGWGGCRKCQTCRENESYHSWDLPSSEIPLHITTNSNATGTGLFVIFEKRFRFECMRAFQILRNFMEPAAVILFSRQVQAMILYTVGSFKTRLNKFLRTKRSGLIWPCFTLLFN